MEVDTNGDIAQRERGIGTLRMEGKFAILVAIPEHTTLRELYHLVAYHRLTLGKIRLVEREVNLLTAHDAHCHIWLLAIII